MKCEAKISAVVAGSPPGYCAKAVSRLSLACTSDARLLPVLSPVTVAKYIQPLITLLRQLHLNGKEYLVEGFEKLLLAFFDAAESNGLAFQAEVVLLFNNSLTLFSKIELRKEVRSRLIDLIGQFLKPAAELETKYLFGLLCNHLALLLVKNDKIFAALTQLQKSIEFYTHNDFFQGRTSPSDLENCKKTYALNLMHKSLFTAQFGNKMKAGAIRSQLLKFLEEELFHHEEFVSWVRSVVVRHSPSRSTEKSPEKIQHHLPSNYRISNRKSLMVELSNSAMRGEPPNSRSQSRKKLIHFLSSRDQVLEHKYCSNLETSKFNLRSSTRKRHQFSFSHKDLNTEKNQKLNQRVEILENALLNLSKNMTKNPQFNAKRPSINTVALHDQQIKREVKKQIYLKLSDILNKENQTINFLSNNTAAVDSHIKSQPLKK